MKVIHRALSLFIVFIGFILTGCSDDAGSSPVAGNATLTTTAVTGITSSGATSGGAVTADGGSAVKTRGVVWSTASAPSVNLTTKTTDGSGTGTFTSAITGLSPNTTYFVRAYATNDAGTAYGNEVTFTTPSLPVVTTTTITQANETTAIGGGIITADGGSPVSARGIVWDTSPNPTVELTTKTSDGSGTGTFTSTLTNLADGRYYVRAYATNSTGTAYGNEVMFVAIAAFTELDDAIAAQMTKYNIPGVSLAVIRNEKLVYAKSYGYADKEAGQPAANDNLYRIASISKPITAIVILKLVQEGKLTLDQKVFGTGAILGTDYGTVPAGSQKDNITIRHLLDHKSGWTNTPTDPMFSDVTLTQTQLIKDMLANRALTYTPGQTEYYLNFGYCVLGRVIEKVTGKKYDEYVKTILQDMGITGMVIAGNTLNDRLPNEVKYYQPEYDPYTMNVTRMDSHGGWLATATDLGRFMVRIDRNSSVQDVVSVDQLSNMYFGYERWAHTGSLPGTSTFIIREDDTFSFVVLANTRSESNYDAIINSLYGAVVKPVKARASWPAYDLF